LGGIGFTMSIFIGELAFIGKVGLFLEVKTGIIAASLFAGGIGFIWLCLVCEKA
jgi:NhaA family Na+:H+ antiporter